MRESSRRGSSERWRPGPAPRCPAPASPWLAERSEARCEEAGARVPRGWRPQVAAVTAVSVTWWLPAAAGPPARPASAGSIPPLPGARALGLPQARRPLCFAPLLLTERAELPAAAAAWGLGHGTEPGVRWRTGGGWMALTGPGRRCQGSAWLSRSSYTDLLCSKPWKRRTSGEDGRSFLEQKFQAMQNCGAGFGLWSFGTAQTQPGANPDAAVLKVVSVLLLLGLRLLHCSMESLLFELNSDLLIRHLTVLWFWMNMAHSYY